MDYNFSNKVVLVTGASAGIGEATALLFARFGAHLVLVGRNEMNLKDVAERCSKQNGIAALPIVADLGTDEGCENTATVITEQIGRLDVLVNNAALGGRDMIETGSMELFDKLFSVNVRGVYNLTRLLVPTLIKTKGNIVNVSSILGTKTNVGSVTYSMTKAAINHFSRLIALELAPKGVRVNTVSPGLTISNFHIRMFGYNEDEYEKFLEDMRSKMPMGEVCTSEDIGKAIVHLASDHSRLITGSLVKIDGGSELGTRM